MTERQKLLNITYITDHDAEMYHMGEIDGIFQDRVLKEFFKIHGDVGLKELLCHLAFLQHQAISVRNELREKEDLKCGAQDES